MTLRPRHRQVFELVCQGYSHKMIAAQLGVCKQTVDKHLASLCRQLGAHSAIELIRAGIREGLPVVEWLRK